MSFPTPNSFFSAVAVMTLASCGGSATQGHNMNFAVGSFDEWATLSDQLGEDITAAGITPTDDLPTSGTASYDGVISLTVVDTPTLTNVGQVSINVNLSNGAVSGEAGNFFNLIGQSEEGSLTFSNGQILRIPTDNIFGADLDGQVVFEDEARTVDGSFLGGFSGPAGEFLAGLISASGRTANGSVDSISGAILLED